MEIVDYENTIEIPLNVAYDNNAGASNNSSVPGINTPKIDAKVSVYNIPNPPAPTADLVGWSTDIVFSATDSDTVARTAGSIKLASGTSLSVNAGNTGNISTVTYIYYNGTTTLQTTTTPQTAVGTGKIMICTAKNVVNESGKNNKAQFQAFGTLGNGVFITADNIAANTITANEIAANTISATQIRSDYVYAGTINADNIISGTITGRTLQTGTTGQRVVISSSNNRIDFYNSDNVLSGQIVGGKVGSIQVLALSSSGYIYSGTTHLTQHLYPLSDASYDLGASSLGYNNLYLNGTITFDSGDGVMSEVSGYPKRSANGSSTYYIPLLTGASTNKTTNASIKMNFGGTEYYINVLAV